MVNNKIKIVSMAFLMATTLNITGCKKEEVKNNVSNTNKIQNNYSKEVFQNEYREYLECLTYLTHEIPCDTYIVLGHNFNETKYNELKQTQLISFDNIDKLKKLVKTSKVKEIKTLAQKLLKESEKTQYQLLDLANKEGIIDTVEETKTIIDEYTKVLTEDLARLEFNTIQPLLEKNEATKIKKEVKKNKSSYFKDQRDRYISKLEYLYGDKTKKILNSIYDNL